VLALALVLSMATWFSASAVVPQLRDEWDLSRNAAAWLTIAVQLGFVAGALASSLTTAADVIPPHVVVFCGSLGAAAANAAIVLTNGPGGAIPLRFATGFFLAGVYPPALKLMATWYRRGRGTALGILVGALTLGSALPHLVNGLGGLDWQVVIVVTSVLTLVGGLIALAEVPEGPTGFHPPASTLGRRGSSSPTEASASPRSATSGICGSCTRCGPGSSSSRGTASSPRHPPLRSRRSR